MPRRELVSRDGGESKSIPSRLCASYSFQQPLGQSVPISQMETPHQGSVESNSSKGWLALVAAHGLVEPLHFSEGCS